MDAPIDERRKSKKNNPPRQMRAIPTRMAASATAKTHPPRQMNAMIPKEISRRLSDVNLISENIVSIKLSGLIRISWL